LTEFDLRSLLGTLNDHGVEFVVIGGVAVGAHGFIRGT
jgi:predicted nucleotidyltransferase